MTVATVADFVEALRVLPLLTPEQQAQLPALRQQFADLKAFGQELVRRGWLTLFQANQVGKGKAHELVLDQYVLLDLLGQGGMGSVFKAKQSRMKRLVALKVIRREALKSPGAVERFRREAEAAAKLAHPNVVTVFDTNEVKGLHFLVMEYLEGTDLAGLLHKQGVPAVPLACEYIRQAALGLQHAHEQGLVHRDIKPHNLMLTKKGVVKVMDLGLARTAHKADGVVASEGLTATGAVMGTADYIAPEQAQDAKRADIRADIYSLGCTFYHLLAGEPPFEGGTLANKIVAHMFTEPDALDARRPDVPPALAAVVRRMMAKKPEERFPTPSDVAAALEPFAHAAPVGSATSLAPAPAAALLAAETIDAVRSRPPAATLTLPAARRPPRRRRVLLPVSLAFVVLLGGLAALLLTSKPAPDSRPHAAAVPTSERGVSGAPSTPARATHITPPRTAPTLPQTGPATKPDTRPIVPPKFERMKDKEYKDDNSIGMIFVKIPKGTFKMGSPVTEQDRVTDAGIEPQHDVTISESFYLGVFTVTQAEYEKVMDDNPSSFKSVPGQDTRRFPVEKVTWDEAKKFCDTLTEKEKSKYPERKYRLPTEAEWEYACRGGAASPTTFHFGNTLTSDLANFNGEYPYPAGTPKGDYLKRPTTVGSYKPNAFGLYDMHGNVYQWCKDWHAPYDLKETKDPQGPTNPTSDRVLRGGSWYSGALYCRSAARGWGVPGGRVNCFGFRVVLVGP